MENEEKLPSESAGQVNPSDSKADIPEPTPELKEDSPKLAPLGEESPEVFVPEAVLAPKKSKGERFMGFIRKMITWILVFLLVYLAGVVTIYVLEYQPTKDALEQTQLELEQANSTIADQQSELDDAYFMLSYNAYLEVVADLYAARLGLAIDDSLGAKAALATTDVQLELILDDVAAFDQALADSLPQRLSLIINNIDADVERAILDAEFLSEDLDRVYLGVYYQN